jgi:hypothetical protein
MALMVIIHIKGGTLDQYDQATKELFNGTLQPSELPDGLLSHAAAQTDDGVKVVDIWNSKDTFDSFQEKLTPALQHANAPQAEPKLYEVHNYMISKTT